MNGKNRAEAADKAAVGGEAGGAAPLKEKIFSIIRKASEEGITDSHQRMLWLDFTPHIAVVKKEGEYVVWMWREGVVVKVFLDEDFRVISFDVEGPL